MYTGTAAFPSATGSGPSVAAQANPRVHLVENAIEVRNLSFSYTGRKVLDSISFGVARGVICGLLGPNGSGKTTLLRCIGGLRKPTGGQATVQGIAITSMTRQEIARRISMVPQQTSMVFPFKAIELVVMGKCPELGYCQSPKKADYVRAQNLMESLRIGHLAYRRISELSGGERQLTVVARALFQGADIMLLDEPTTYLDYKNQLMILDSVTGIARNKNLTVIMTSHDPNLAFHYCDKMVLLKEGRVVCVGSTRDVFQGGTLSKLYDMDVSVADVKARDCQVVLPSHW